MLQKKEEEVEHLKKRIEDLNITNNENTALLNNKDKNISELQNRLEETLSLNNRLDLSIKKQKDEINSLEESIQSKEIFIEKLSSESLTKERLIERVKQKWVIPCIKNSVFIKSIQPECRKWFACSENWCKDSKSCFSDWKNIVKASLLGHLFV